MFEKKQGGTAVAEPETQDTDPYNRALQAVARVRNKLQAAKQEREALNAKLARISTAEAHRERAERVLAGEDPGEAAEDMRSEVRRLNERVKVLQQAADLAQERVNAEELKRKRAMLAGDAEQNRAELKKLVAAVRHVDQLVRERQKRMRRLSAEIGGEVPYTHGLPAPAFPINEPSENPATLQRWLRDVYEHQGIGQVDFDGTIPE